MPRFAGGTDDVAMRSARATRRRPPVAAAAACLLRGVVRDGERSVLVATVLVERVVERLEESFLLVRVVLIDLRFG